MKLYHTYMLTTSIEERIENTQYVGQMMVTIGTFIIWYAKDYIQRIEHEKWDSAKDANVKSQ